MCGREKKTWEHGRRNVEGGGREGAGRRWWKVFGRTEKERND